MSYAVERLLTVQEENRRQVFMRLPGADWSVTATLIDDGFRDQAYAPVAYAKENPANE